MADHLFALPSGFRLERYKIRRVLSTGRYGIKYVAVDTRDGKQVAIKEYLPEGVGVRAEGGGVVPRSSAVKSTFETGLARFIDRARVHERLDHPALVAAHRWFEAHGTAFVVMDYVQGATLAATLADGGQFSETELLALANPVLDAVAKVHQVGFLHQDIRPGTIIRRKDNSPLLLELGGGRRHLGGARAAFTAAQSEAEVIAPTPGYSALEQYSSRSRTGPWTDIYALGAVLYHCVAGRPPPDAPSRVINDEYVPIAQAARGQYGEHTLVAIESALSISATERPSSIAAWRAKFAGRGGANRARRRYAPRVAVRGGAPPPAAAGGSQRPGRRVLRWVAPVVVAIALIAGLTWLDVGVLPDDQGVGAPVAAPATGWATLAVATTPPGADVLLDGAKVGETPLRLADLAAGEVKLTLRHPLHETIEMPAARLIPGRVTNISRKLVRSTGDLEVITDPPGAWVEVDGERQEALTPTVLTGIPTGSVAVVVGAEGYTPRQVSAEVVRREQRAVRVAMESSVVYGTLTVEVAPADASIALLDVAASYRPGVRLPEGSYQVRVSRAGYLPQTRAVAVSGDARASFALTLDPQPFTVAVTPAAAEVRFMDGAGAYSPGVRLPPGDYRVRALLVGHRTWEETIRHGNAPTTRTVTLSPGVAEFADMLPDAARGPLMVLVPPGGFRMGCVSGVGCRRDEAPAHGVAFAAPFALSKYEVTFDEFDLFTAAAGRPPVAAPRGWERTNRPVVNVSWEDASAYAQWLSEATGRRYRLPSEAEWEYAARAGTATAYSWGDEPGSANANCKGCGSDWDNSSAAPVGFFAANPWGLHDMHGNVWEWVQDCRSDSYAGAPGDGAALAAGSCLRRMMRGGSWSNSPEAIRAARREWDEATLSSPQIGFRIAAAAQ